MLTQFTIKVKQKTEEGTFGRLGLGIVAGIKDTFENSHLKDPAKPKLNESGSCCQSLGVTPAWFVTLWVCPQCLGQGKACFRTFALPSIQKEKQKRLPDSLDVASGRHPW